MGGVIEIVGWDQYQHYKDRDPPWVKLYRDLLTSESWVLGTDISRLVQVASILLAARYHNATPVNFRLIKKVASLDCTEAEFLEALRHLASHNFLKVKGETGGASKVLAICYQDARPETEQSRAEGEQRRAEGEAELPVPQERDRVQSKSVQTIFDHWKQTHQHPRAALTDKRRKLIRESLRHYSEAELCQSITGYLNSPHHMGQNDRSTKYDDIDLLLRDAKHIDQGLRFYEQPPAQHSQLTNDNIQRIREWVPPELRGLKHEHG